MDGWVGWLAFGLLVAAVAAGIASAIRRAREIRESARQLGMTYRAHDDELARVLQGALPMFDRDDIRCDDVTTCKTLFGDCHLFRYSYLGRNAAGRRDRVSAGLVACLEASVPLGEKLKPQRLAAASARWTIEHKDQLLAMRRRSEGSESAYSGRQLRDFHAGIQKLLAMLFGATPHR